MKTNLKYQENRRDFMATCSDMEVKKTEKTMYKHCQMFGPKTLIFWIDTGRISTRQGHVTPKN